MFGVPNLYTDAAAPPTASPILLRGLPPSFIRGNPRYSPVRGKMCDNSYIECSPSLPCSSGSVSLFERTLAPTTRCSSDDLAEIPLRTSVSEKNDQQGTCYLLDPPSPFFSNTLHTIGSTSDSSAYASSVSRFSRFIDLICGDADPVHMLSETNEVHLPSVEDGLSSGSDLDVPVCNNMSERVCATNPIRPPCFTSLSSGDSYAFHTTDELSSQVAADVSHNSDSLVNPPLVRDIWGIMNELKQTLAEEHNSLNKADGLSSLPTTLNAVHSDQSAVDLAAASSLEFISEGSQPPVTAMNPLNHLCASTEVVKPGDCGSCAKLVVQASVERNTEDPEKNVWTGAHDQGRIRMRSDEHGVSKNQGDTHVSCERRMCHWNFPPQPDTLYSSGEDEIEEKVELSHSSRYSHTTRASNGLTSRKCSVNQEIPTAACHSRSHMKDPAPMYALASHIDHRLNQRSTKLPMMATCGATTAADTSLNSGPPQGFESDEDTRRLLENQYQSEKPMYIPELKEEARLQAERRNRVRDVSVRHPDFPDSLINGVLFRARYLGSTQLLSERQPTRQSRMFQAQEAVNRIKAPDDENQPSVVVEFFVSTNRLMILNNNHQEILIDHELQTVSYIADIGELFVLMARRPGTSQPVPTSSQTVDQLNSSESSESRADSERGDSLSESEETPSSTSALPRVRQTQQSPSKLICHVLESSEARMISQTVGHAFQLAYLNFLREHGIDYLSSMKTLTYEDVLNQQEIFCDELTMFSDKDRHKQISIPKQYGEPLGVVVVASGWGSLIPSVLLANMNPNGPAARCGQLNIGNHIISVNDRSLVGLPVNSCRKIIKTCRHQTSVKLVVVDCPPVVEVLIRRPSLHYQLGFSVQDGVICSLLRGGIAERGGIRVDHRIIEINGQSVVAVPHEKIVQLLSSAVGEIHIRTMPTSVFRLLTGQETPHYI